MRIVMIEGIVSTCFCDLQLYGARKKPAMQQETVNDSLAVEDHLRTSNDI